jgi:hypothetical protein
MMKAYAEMDARFSYALQKAFDAKNIQVGTKTYDRSEWEQYLKDRRYWKILDPFVTVPKPDPIDFRK